MGDNLWIEVVPPPQVLDFTGQVTRTYLYSFAVGGSADVYKGQWIGNGSNSPREVEFFPQARPASLMFYGSPGGSQDLEGF